MRGLIHHVAVMVAAVAGTLILVIGMVTVAGTGAEAAVTVTGAEAPLPAGGVAANVFSVSCSSAGNCAAAGIYTGSSGNRQGLLLTQTAGSWAATEAPLPTGAAGNQGFGLFLDSVSCASAGNCTAVGQYLDSSGNDLGLLLTLAAGSWATAQAPLPSNAATSGQIVNVNSVSCTSAGNCTAVGTYIDSSGNDQGLLLTQNTSALYGFGGFMAPVPKSTLTYKAGSAIPVKFVLTDASGQPIPAATAAALAANKEVEATLTGPGTSTTVLAQAYCSWNTTGLFFQCNLKTPSGLKTGKANPYAITVLESPGGGFVPAPPANANPETVFFK